MTDRAGWNHQPGAVDADEIDVIVSMYMATDVATVASNHDIAAAVVKMARHRVRCLPVVDDGRLVGILSKSDVLRCAPNKINPFSAEARAMTRLGFTVEDAMSPMVTTIAPNASIDAAAQLLDERRLSTLVVVDDGEVVGMLSRTDILRAFREVVYSDRATRFTLAVDDGVDVAGPLLANLAESGLELTAYAEHRHGDQRYVLIALAGSRAAVDAVVDSAWNQGVRVLQVARVPA